MKKLYFFCFLKGATTLSRTIFSIPTLSIKGLKVTFSITTLSIMLYVVVLTECHVLFIIMLDAVMLSVVAPFKTN
jgi:hypothetical protein